MKKGEVAIFGFGRVGGPLARQIISRNEMNLVHIGSKFTSIETAEKAASQVAKLLYHNQPYPNWDGHQISVEGDTVLVDGKAIKIEKVDSPEKIKWPTSNPAVVFEASGANTTRPGLEPFLKLDGVKWVVLTSPAKDNDGSKEIPTITIGANDHLLEQITSSNERIISAASCTTMCLAPLAKVLDETFGINKANMTTVHAVTQSQNLTHGTAKDARLMAPAMNNIIVYKTGASEALAKVLPELAPRFELATAIRVPTLTGSVLVLEAQVVKPVGVEAVNRAFRDAAAGRLHGIVDVLEKGSVRDQADSGICIGNPHSALILESATEVSNDQVKVVVFYDNEWAYCHRLQDLALKLVQG